MSATSFPVVRGRMMRVTKVDGCGNPIDGPANMITTEGFVSVALSSQITEAEEITVENAGGKVCVRDVGSPTFDGYGVEITFCEVEPCLFSLLTGQQPIMNQAGDIVGFTMNSKRFATTGFALEVWTGSPAADACSGQAAGAQPAGYFVLPNLQGGVLGDFTIENAAITFSVTGAATKDGNSWGVGPYSGGFASDPNPVDAGPYLDNPLDVNDHLGIAWTTNGYPGDSDGCAQLTAVTIPFVDPGNIGLPGAAVPASPVVAFDTTTAGEIAVTITRGVGVDGATAGPSNPAVFPATGKVTVHWGDGTSDQFTAAGTSLSKTGLTTGDVLSVTVEAATGISDITEQITVT